MLPALLCLSSTSLFADTIARRDGSTVEGEVLSVDGQKIVMRTSSGTVSLPRREVVSIHFSESEALLPPLKVEIRNIRSDDSVDVLVNDEIVLREGREGGSWIDLTSRLKEGNNALRLRIHNDRGTWAYRLGLRVNGVVSTLSCGKPLDRSHPCRCCGKTGTESGIIEDLPIVWLFVDRQAGSAEILR